MAQTSQQLAEMKIRVSTEDNKELVIDRSGTTVKAVEEEAASFEADQQDEK